jgi:hypothetical protein
MLINDFTQAFIDLIPLEEKFVEVRLSQDTPKGGESNLGGCFDIVSHLYHRLHGVLDHEVNDGIDFDGDVILGDDDLGLHDHGDHPKVDPNHPINNGDDQIETRVSRLNESSESENDASLILSNNLDGEAEKYNPEKSQDDDQRHPPNCFHEWFSSSFIIL